MFRSLVKLFNKGEIDNTQYIIAKRMVDLRNLLGFSVVTPKGIIGAVEDFAVEEPQNKAVFIIINTNDLFMENNLLVSLDYINKIDFDKRYLYLTKTIDEIRS